MPGTDPETQAILLVLPQMLSYSSRGSWELCPSPQPASPAHTSAASHGSACVSQSPPLPFSSSSSFSPPGIFCWISLSFASFPEECVEGLNTPDFSVRENPPGDAF